MELSSYQTELTPNLACETAVLLNISSDHLDRHGGLDGYVTAKTELFAHPHAKATAVIGIDDEFSCKVFDTLSSNQDHSMIAISASNPVDGGIYVTGGILVDARDGEPRTITDLRKVPALPGQHNWQNAAASYAIARVHDVTSDDITAAFNTFPGLPHRQEIVAMIAGVTFVNDSKATNAAAAEKALACYGCVYWIAGGQAKDGGIAALNSMFGRIHHAFLIGEAGQDFAATLQRAGVPVSIHKSLDEAVSRAGRLAITEARDGATVLLSPACASFDMFDNFEHRGDAFRDAVYAEWPEATSTAAQGHA